MAIENFDGGIMVTDESVSLYRALALGHGLALEINTGMKLSSKGSVMLAAAAFCGSTKRTKRGVLKDYVAYMKKAIPTFEPSERIVKALAKPSN
jgi:hypothetical protein